MPGLSGTPILKRLKAGADARHPVEKVLAQEARFDVWYLHGWTTPIDSPRILMLSESLGAWQEFKELHKDVRATQEVPR